MLCPHCDNMQHNNKEKKRENLCFGLASSLVAACRSRVLPLMSVIVLFHLPIDLTMGSRGTRIDLYVFCDRYCSGTCIAVVFFRFDLCMPLYEFDVSILQDAQYERDHQFSLEHWCFWKWKKCRLSWYAYDLAGLWHEFLAVLFCAHCECIVVHLISFLRCSLRDRFGLMFHPCYAEDSEAALSRIHSE